MKNIHIHSLALKLALRELGLNTEDITDVLLRPEGELVHIEFRSDWMEYEVYVSVGEMSVPGIDFRPLPDRSDYRAPVYMAA